VARRDLETRFQEFDFKSKQINGKQNIDLLLFQKLKITFIQYMAILALAGLFLRQGPKKMQ
jgi:hypothetical protein